MKMSKQHYFVIFGERNKDGNIEWHLDTEIPVNSEEGDKPIYNTETSEWESIEKNHHEDAAMMSVLLSTLKNSWGD
jgi:hypothetical protein